MPNMRNPSFPNMPVVPQGFNFSHEPKRPPAERESRFDKKESREDRYRVNIIFVCK